MTSSAILDAAEGVFAEQGLQGARMEDIAARAGVAVGTLYNYFSDRQKLVAALHHHRKRELFELFDAALAAHPAQPFEAKLGVILRALLGHFDAHRAFFALLMQGETGAERAEALGAIRATMKEMFARFDRLMAGGVEAGVLRPVDAPLYAASIFGLLRGVLIREHCGGGTGGTAGERADALVRLFLDGARARCPGPHDLSLRSHPNPKDTL